MLFIGCTQTSCGMPRWLKTTTIGRGRPIESLMPRLHCRLLLLSR